PAQPVREAAIGYAILLAYIGWSASLLWASFFNWSLEYRTSFGALVVDGLVGVASVYFTQDSRNYFATPLTAFFVFGLVSAAQLGGWRIALAFGGSFTLGVLGVSLYLIANDLDIDSARIARSTSYFLILTALVVWYAGRRTAPAVSKFELSPAPSAGIPYDEVLGYAAQTLSASRGLLIWRGHTQPETVLRCIDDGLECNWLRDPASLEPLVGRWDRSFLFRTHGPTAITLDREGRTVPLTEIAIVTDMASLDLRDGLCIPIRASTGEGTIVLSGLLMLGRDLLPIAESAAREIALTLDKQALALISYEKEMGRLRQTVARDLHDSVAQSLAGASFRVEAARKAIGSGKSADAELAAVKEALQSEQRQLRAIIDRLRTGLDLRVRKDLGQDLAELLPEMEAQWHLQTRLVRPEEPIDVGPNQLHDLRQIAREAVANAARHGGATLVQFDLGAEPRSFHLDIVDNGTGGSTNSTHPFQPRSIAERVAALGGTLDARRGPAGTRLYINVPRLSA
ncbi:MAG: histidine kinase, partial [Novosphingobium sp.]|nr:histidine kinase [Novosphingobium sp.]